MRADRDLERKFVRDFLRDSSVLVGVRAEVQDPDPPDVVIRAAHGTIGVEVTRVFIDGAKGSKLRETESNRELVCGRVGSLLEAREISPLLVSVAFTGDLFSSRRRNAVAEQIATLVTKHQPLGDSTVAIGPRTITELGDFSGLWPSEVAQLTVTRDPAVSMHEVVPSDSGFMFRECATLLQKSIDTKSDRLHRYRDQYTEAWLLMVAEWSGPASFILPSQAACDHLYGSQFTRTFFWTRFNRSWFELRTSTTPTNRAER